MTLKELMAADVENVFLKEDDFAEDVEWYKGGDFNVGKTVVAIVVGDNLEGTREVHGDGRVLHSVAGTNLRDSYTLEISTKHEITGPKGAGSRDVDVFRIRDRIFTVKRVIGIDDDFQSVLCVRTEVNTTRRGERRG